jgi:hypothetical protein
MAARRGQLLEMIDTVDIQRVAGSLMPALLPKAPHAAQATGTTAAMSTAPPTWARDVKNLRN